jgi:dienelactone hydrolase
MVDGGTTSAGGPLAGFTRRAVSVDGQEKDVWFGGTGPAVIVVAEVPGITPRVASFGRLVVDAGFTAVLPRLFGEPGREPSIGYALKVITRACISSEFTALALRRTSPVTTWLRGLAAQVHVECGGPGVGAVGMCLTGGFALAMMVDDVVLAPVLSQPSLPLPLSKGRRQDIGISDADLARVKERCAAGCEVLGLRFTGDRAVPPERFARLKAELGDAFIAVEIDSSRGNPEGYRKAAHSVLTEDLRDEEGSATRAALEQVLQFFEAKLRS